MMGFLSKIVGDAQSAFARYKGDGPLLAAFAAAGANVTAADGQIDDDEIDAALAGIGGNEGLRAAFTPAEIEAAVTKALANAKTRMGRMENLRAIQNMAARPIDVRQNIFLVAADVADQGGSIGTEEDAVLTTIAKELGLDKTKLLG